MKVTSQILPAGVCWRHGERDVVDAETIVLKITKLRRAGAGQSARMDSR